MNKKHQGAHSELTVSARLLQLGYEVFRNVSAHGMADLVAYKPSTGEILLIDVKTGTSFSQPTADQMDHGVKFICVTTDADGNQQTRWLDPPRGSGKEKFFEDRIRHRRGVMDLKK
jgi:hypothetical protein